MLPIRPIKIAPVNKVELLTLVKGTILQFNIPIFQMLLKLAASGTVLSLSLYAVVPLGPKQTMRFHIKLSSTHSEAGHTIEAFV